MGNQMFQYAAAKATAKRLGTELLLDLHYYDRNSQRIGRSYVLDCFNPPEKTATIREIMRLFPLQAISHWIKGDASSIVERVSLRAFCSIINIRAIRDEYTLKNNSDTPFVSIPFSRVYREKTHYYTPYFLDIADDTYMVGFFESEKFWHGFDKKDIFSIFSFDASFHEDSLLNEINETQSVSIHVRRGDKVNSAFKPTSLEYIEQALLIIKGKIRQPSFFVFSDDIAWCKIYLPPVVARGGGGYVSLRFVENKSVQEDLFLMTRCKHNITAPSTFSWWGAYLNVNPEKIIIAPHESLWYERYEDRYDLLPKGEGWIILR
ncbi:alpha-1,2-fucosyltransferase [Synergistales bacterium]|nr:alpha-1,2-fucosyltransferase [Synergistales bacterium]